MDGSSVVKARAENDDKKPRRTGELAHYGGSARTVDGARGKKKQLENEEEDDDDDDDEEGEENIPFIPIVQRKGGGNTSTNVFGFPGVHIGSVASAGEPPKAAAARLLQDDDEDLIDEDASESDFSIELALPKKSAATAASRVRAAPKRQASLKGKSYSAVDNESDGSSDEDSNIQEVPHPKPAAPKRKAHNNRKATAKGKSDAGFSDSSEDSDDDVEEIIPVSKRSKIAQVQSIKKKKDKSCDPPNKRAKSAKSESDSDESGSNEILPKTSRSAGKGKGIAKKASMNIARPSRKSAATAKKKVTDILDSSSDDEKSDEGSVRVEVPHKKAGKKSVGESDAAMPKPSSDVVS
ncbi:MAG: hypothetical protein SGARI_004289, partial [Bacillariaceae sp.]